MRLNRIVDGERAAFTPSLHVFFSVVEDILTCWVF